MTAATPSTKSGSSHKDQTPHHCPGVMWPSSSPSPVPAGLCVLSPSPQPRREVSPVSLPGSVSVSPPCPLTPRFLPQTDVFIAMELMGTCAEKLKKRIQGPIPERILGKMTVAVSGEGTLGDTARVLVGGPPLLTPLPIDREGPFLPEREARGDPP